MQDGQLDHNLGRMRYEVMEQLIGLSRVLEARRKRHGTIFLTINFNHIVMVFALPRDLALAFHTPLAPLAVTVSAA